MMITLWGVISIVACAPGRLERVEYVDKQGNMHRVEFRKDATAEDVLKRLGPPSAVKRGGKGIRYWVYALRGARWNYVFRFRNGRLSYINYLLHHGESP